MCYFANAQQVPELNPHCDVSFLRREDWGGEGKGRGGRGNEKTLLCSEGRLALVLR